MTDTVQPNATARAHEFLRDAKQFQLGRLPTETPHPKTSQLSHLAQNDLPKALKLLQEIDCDAIEAMLPAASNLGGLRQAISETIASGGRIFLCGCGATGRLSLSLEVLWREQNTGHALQKVVAFMAGGDLALVRSIENFEDHPEYGARQLDELGFSDNDLLVSTTEGGETPFVIGATEQAAKRSSRKPWFLYCNPDDILSQVAERSRRIIENPSIRKVNLTIGSMALSGSTRMQASTVLMLGVGVCLLPQNRNRIEDELKNFLDIVRETDYAAISKFTELETAHYQNACFTVYKTTDYGITILTDTTERSPTFSLRVFENVLDEGGKPALCYLSIPNSKDAIDGYVKLLHREPRTLEWEDNVAAIAGRERLKGYDFSTQGLTKRETLIGKEKIATMQINRTEKNAFSWKFADFEKTIAHSANTLLHEHLLLKVLLNAHSTLIMGRLGRFEQNLMTFVKPSNKKLVDRTIRYVQILLGQNAPYTYEQIAVQCFHSAEKLKDDEPIVLRIIKDLQDRRP